MADEPQDLSAEMDEISVSALEKSVKRLAGALDALERRLEGRVAGADGNGAKIPAARVNAQTAKTQAAAAADDLGDAIRDLRALITSGTKG